MEIKNKRIHFIGAGGIGVSALARLMKLSGAEVTGSDMRQSLVTDALEKLGCKIYIGHAAENLSSDTNLVVHTEDVNESSSGFVELNAARTQSIETLKYSEALGKFMDGFKAVGVSGTNGKSTTTAILGLIMEAGQTDPMVVLGSRLAPKNESEAFQGNARFGQGEYFVYEADEYHRHMLDSQPFAAILTNIEADHLDYYKNLADIMSAFQNYVISLPENGILVYNSDDINTVAAVESAKCRRVSFSMINKNADYFADAPRTVEKAQIFEIYKGDKSLGSFQLNIPGHYNVMNALGAVVMAVELGVDSKIAQKALADFAGIWRRFELVGKFGQADVVSDYAHHPTAVAGLILAAKQFYPNDKIMLIFQPHQKNRTKMLFNDFVESLRGVEHIVLPEIFFVAGREKDADSDISSKQLVEQIVKSGQSCEYAENLDVAEKIVQEKGQDFGLIICAGAGTIDSLARKLIAA